MAELRSADGLLRQVLNETGTVIGRLAECDLVVKESTASRKHARVWWERGRWWVEDLNSTAGTRIDGEKIKVHPLADGDRLEIGQLVLIFSDPRGTPMPAPSRELTEPLVRPQSPLIAERPLRGIELLGAMRSDVREGAPPLLAMVQVGSRLRDATTVEAVAGTVLDAALVATGADRGVLVRFGPDGSPTSETHLARRAGDGKLKPSPSHVQRVVDQRVALLATDAGAGAPAAAAAVAAQGMRAVLCAPMWDGERISGYVALDRRGAGFRDEDLDLVVALGATAAAEMARVELLAQTQEGSSARQYAERFLGADALRRLEREGPIANALVPRDRPVTVVHADVLGLDDLMRKLPAGQLTRLLDAHLGAMIEVAVDRSGGTLERMSGSELRFVFGAPTGGGEQEDARAAVRAAMAMAQAAEAARVKQTLLARVRLRIGVHTGPAIVGLIGPAKRAVWTVLGPTPDGADRVAAASGPGRVLLSGATYNALRGGFDCVIADVTVPGIEGGVWWAAREFR